jgi:hypothetical protein
LNTKQPKLFLVPLLLGQPLLAMPVRNLMHPLCTCSCPLVHPYGYALGYGYCFHYAPTVGYTVEHKATEHIPGAVTAVAGEPTVVHVAGKKFDTSF